MVRRKHLADLVETYNQIVSARREETSTLLSDASDIVFKGGDPRAMQAYHTLARHLHDYAGAPVLAFLDPLFLLTSLVLAFSL